MGRNRSRIGLTAVEAAKDERLRSGRSDVRSRNCSALPRARKLRQGACRCAPPAVGTLPDAPLLRACHNQGLLVDRATATLRLRSPALAVAPSNAAPPLCTVGPAAPQR